jgi:LCP family protein required for cell wall assembly
MSMKDKKRIGRGIIIACVMCAVVAVCFALSALFIRAPEMGEQFPGKDERPQDGVYPDTENPPVPTEKPPDDETGTEIDIGAKEPDPVGGDRREGVYTILLAGTSDDYSADTIMVCTVDTVGKTVNVLGIPRDTRVEAARAVKKINTALGVGGIGLLKKEVAGILGFMPDFYIKVGLDGLINLVDAIDGVYFDIPYRMDYDDPSQDLHIHFEPGYRRLDGQAAMELVRYRGHAGSDLSRMKIQQDFLMAVAKKVIKPQNITKVGTFAKIYAENVETDLTVGNLIWFALRGFEIGTENIHMHTLPTYTKDKEVNPYYYQFVNSKKAIELINETVNPYKNKITAKNVIHVPFTAPTDPTGGGGLPEEGTAEETEVTTEGEGENGEEDNDGASIDGIGGDVDEGI